MIDPAAVSLVEILLVDRDEWSSHQVAPLIPVTTAAELAALVPDMDGLREACDRLGLLGTYLYSAATADGRITARMFAPSIGVPEDIVNANSTARLAAHLSHQALPHSPSTWATPWARQPPSPPLRPARRARSSASADSPPSPSNPPRADAATSAALDRLNSH